MKIGIVGLPNVGKSTLFSALTKKQVNCANYPFCTISPNIGVVAVPDSRLEKLGKILKSPKIIPEVLEFVDIAGLVRNAHKGEGLGNQFLSHIREGEAILHVVRSFSDPNVSHLYGTTKPKEDIEIVNLELQMADLEVVEKRLKDLKAKAKANDKEAKQMASLLEKIKTELEKNRPVREINLTEEEKKLIKSLNLLTAKPMLYVFNTDEKNPSLPPEYANDKNALAICAKIENELAQLPPKEAQEMRKIMGLGESGLDKLIKASYRLLNLITFYTYNKKEVRAWAVSEGTKAPLAARKIHSDFEKKFICAEVIKYSDFIKYGSAEKVKEHGLVHIEGKDYLVQDGDIIYFRHAP